MLRIKPGVSIKKIQPQMVVALVVAEGAYDNWGYDTIITSGDDGVHGPNSLHGAGYAVDLRTSNVKSEDTKAKITRDIKDALGKDFDVVLEKDHLHVEYQPK